MLEDSIDQQAKAGGNEQHAIVSNRLQRIAIFLAFVAVIVSLVLGIRSEKSKELSVRHLGAKPLIGSTSGNASRFRLSVGGVPVEQPWLYSIRVENTGSLPIESRDVEGPLGITFSEGRVLGAELANLIPKNLSAVVESKSNSVTIAHKLLNPGDSFVVDILLDGQPKSPSVVARISGITGITEVQVQEKDASGKSLVVSMPKSLEFLILAISSLGVAVFLIVGIQQSGLAIKAMLMPKKYELPQNLRDVLGGKIKLFGRFVGLHNTPNEISRVILSAID